MWGACPRIARGRVPSTDPRRRAAGDVGVHRRGTATTQMPPRRRNPPGARGLRAISALLVVDDVQKHRLPPRALISPRKPHARNPLEFSDRLQSGATQAMSVYIVEERQQRRRLLAAAPPWAVASRPAGPFNVDARDPHTATGMI